MDATGEDQDIRVQRASSELIADLQQSLGPFLWKKTSSGKRQIRRRVRAKETDRLVALLEPFQELPQLLDPHLDKFVPLLADAFLACLRSKPPSVTPHTQLLIPLSRAICRLLYTFCKIRGEKVIIRFFSTETRNLELLLSAIESGDQQDGLDRDRKGWKWEERYITLLWLSQLLLAPFDLSTISSTSANFTKSEIHGLAWPRNVPGVTYRVVGLATRYLSSSGKERDSAKVLLVRIGMRRDMQSLGVLHSLVQWATFHLKISAIESSSYQYIGILSFLAGILNSSISTSDMDPYLSSIFQILQTESFMATARSSVVARKTSIKVLRTLCCLVLRQSNTSSSTEMVGIVENTIGMLFESLADSATPVRLAASKAMSVITLKLASDMASQVVEEVLTSLKRNIVTTVRGSRGVMKDLSSVNSSEWHGLILTLSQLLYRRSPPTATLSEILPALLAGLSFEQRSTSGNSIGTNVRDAACFGIWALARRYTTTELQAINTVSSEQRYGNSSTLQILATELVVSASVDPAGNIRRGASAALQELVGRHPNTIDEGIPLVQVVDYHAVALRSRAVNEVSFQAAQLSEFYKAGILDALLGWRGIGDGDASARRMTSIAFGNIICSGTITHASLSTINEIDLRLRELKPRQDDERHGLILCIASISENLKHKSIPGVHIQLQPQVSYILENANASHRRIDLIAEAVSHLIVAFARANSDKPSRHGVLDNEMITNALDLLSKWLRRDEPEVIEASSSAVFFLFPLLNAAQHQVQVFNWITILLKDQSGGRRGQDKAVLSSLFKVFPLAGSLQSDIIDTISKRWNLGHDIETRAAILRYFTMSEAIESHSHDFIDLISAGLDDYTTNARGDVGSLVRVEAVKAAGAIWRNTTVQSDVVNKLYGKGLRLAVEKLDKVRAEAQRAVVGLLVPDAFGKLPISSVEYFQFLLEMQTGGCLRDGLKYQREWGLEMLEGFVGSADTGAEDLVRASRAALANHCEEGNVDLVCEGLYQVLKRNITNDRILVPTMEVIGFLFDVQIMQRSSVNWRSLYILIQKAHFKTGNVRKLEASIRLYGVLVEVLPEALNKLVSMLLHPFPRIRNQVADTLFAARGVGKGVNWIKAGKSDLHDLKEEIGMIV